MSHNLDEKKFPVGKFIMPEEINPQAMESWMAMIHHFPELLRVELEKLKSEDFDKPYRDGGWTIRQVVHHLADSHMNAFIRFKLALAEDGVEIKPYPQDLFSLQTDNLEESIESSMQIIQGVHHRWFRLMESMSDADWNRHYVHPEYGKRYALKEALAQYDWHCRTHLGHIRLLQ
ncbi:bacillithiol transferase BstA [Bacteroidota bacterium]